MQNLLVSQSGCTRVPVMFPPPDPTITLSSNGLSGVTEYADAVNVPEKVLPERSTAGGMP